MSLLIKRLTKKYGVEARMADWLLEDLMEDHVKKAKKELDDLLDYFSGRFQNKATDANLKKVFGDKWKEAEKTIGEAVKVIDSLGIK